MSFFKKNCHFILWLFAITTAIPLFGTKIFAYQADIDPFFGIGSGFDFTVRSIAVQDDEKIIVGGIFTGYNEFSVNRIARLNPNGSLDFSFNIGSGFNSVVYSIAIQSDGKTLIGGSFSSYNGINTNRIARLNPDGSLDTSFNIGNGFNSVVYSIAIQSDGKILVGGNFSSYNGTNINRIARLNPDGSLDSSFNPGNGSNSYVYYITTQSDGKILIGGDFTSYNSFNANRIIRLNSDGNIDFDFNIGSGFNSSVRTITIQSDEKILIGGNFSYYSGIYSNRIARLNQDGSIDASFNIGSGFSSIIYSIETQLDGKILVGGVFNTYQGSGASKILRINQDGSRDNSFNIGNGFDDGGIFSIAIKSDGKILIGGNFSFYNGSTAGNLIALKGDGPVSLQNTSNINNIIPYFTYRDYIFSGSIFYGYERISFKETNGLIPTNLTLSNQNNKLYLPKDIQFKKTNNSNYNGIIYPPVTYTGIIYVDDKPVLSAISVGSANESLTLRNGAATLGIPVVGSNVGDPVSIYSSQNGNDWTYEKGGIVSSVDGQPYVQFTTDHFTYFAIAGSTGSFVINNDNYSTMSGTVTLNISAPSATGMRFSNDGITWSGREAISTSKSWDLSEGYEEKTVYAQFIANGEIYSTSDSIVYGTIGDGTQGNLTLTITGGVTQCVYGTSLNLGSQDGNLSAEGYTFSGDFSPANRYCADYKGLSGWVFTIQTTDLENENGSIISGSNVFISHDVPVVQGHDSCTGHNGDETQFYGSPLSLIEKAEVANNDKICKVDISNVKLKVNVPAYQAPGNYVGTLTITLPNGFDG